MALELTGESPGHMGSPKRKTRLKSDDQGRGVAFNLLSFLPVTDASVGKSVFPTAASCIHIDRIRLAFLIHLLRLKYSETSSVFDNSDQGQGYS